VRILFISSTRIGDAVLSTGLLDHPMRAHPEARFTIVCGRVAEGVFRRMPQLERLISVEKRPIRCIGWKSWGQVACDALGLVVDLRASAIAWLLWTRARKIIQGGRRPGHRLTHLAALLGVDPPPLPADWTAPEDTARAAALLPAGQPLAGAGADRQLAPQGLAGGTLCRIGAAPDRAGRGLARRGDCHSGRAGGSGTQHGDPGSDRLAPGA
jgi:ADP-heptose:LPS heptosyltransferase